MTRLPEMTEFIAQAVQVYWVLGAILVLLVTTSLRLAVRMSAATRHLVWLSTLTLLLLMPAGMLVRGNPAGNWLLPSRAAERALAPEAVTVEITNAPRTEQRTEPFLGDTVSSSSRTTETLAPSVLIPLALVATWLCLSILRLLQLVRAAAHVKQLQTQARSAPPRIQQLVEQLAWRNMPEKHTKRRREGGAFGTGVPGTHNTDTALPRAVGGPSIPRPRAPRGAS